jgi:hypothetical protein
MLHVPVVWFRRTAVSKVWSSVCSSESSSSNSTPCNVNAPDKSNAPTTFNSSPTFRPFAQETSSKKSVSPMTRRFSCTFVSPLSSMLKTSAPNPFSSTVKPFCPAFRLYLMTTGPSELEGSMCTAGAPDTTACCTTICSLTSSSPRNRPVAMMRPSTLRTDMFFYWVRLKFAFRGACP